jgi:hypothetical protein
MPFAVLFICLLACYFKYLIDTIKAIVSPHPFLNVLVPSPQVWDSLSGLSVSGGSLPSTSLLAPCPHPLS